MSIDDPDESTSTPAGARTLTGGAIATFIGVLLLVFGPSPTPGVPLNLHQMAYVFSGSASFCFSPVFWSVCFLSGDFHTAIRLASAHRQVS
jgi:hypothetical protein